MSNTDAFFTAVIEDKRLGGTASAELLALLNTWARFEGTAAKSNPLATTTPAAGSWAFNGDGVQSFPSVEAGVDATVRTLVDTPYYPAIVAAIRQGSPVEAWYAPAVVEEVNTWGTHGFAAFLASHGVPADEFEAPSLPPAKVQPPVGPLPEPPPAPAPAPEPAPLPADGSIRYIVRPGDTLSGIAARYGITPWESLWHFDGNDARIPNPDMIYPGEVVLVPASHPTPPQPPHFTYTVRPGDTLSGIASRYGLSWQQLWRFGDNAQTFPNPDMIHPGQLVQVP